MTTIELLKGGRINSNLIQGIVDFRASHPVREEEQGRIPMPRYLYYGKEVQEQTITALLCGQSLPLARPKAMRKNIPAQNLTMASERPVRDISLHVDMDASGLIGTDTFQDGTVVFWPEPVYRCGTNGGFGILDEISMTRNEALAVLRGVLDFRWTIDVSGYDMVYMDGETRFITTMNCGYAGTGELNEVLASRFACLQMPAIFGENLEKLMSRRYPGLKRTYIRQLVQLFLDIDRKCQSAQLSTRPLSLRRSLDAVRLMGKGLDVGAALDMGFTNKSFDPYEQSLVRGLVRARIPKELKRERLFADWYGDVGI